MQSLCYRASGLDEELKRDPHVNWIIEFYAAWSPASINFAPTYSKISANYHRPNLKFGSISTIPSHSFLEPETPFFKGKIDVGRYPDVAEKYHINTSALTRQLPIVILFQNGVEAGRVPSIVSGKVQKFFFKKEELVSVFNINNLCSE
jgi:hypothetical protein